MKKLVIAIVVLVILGVGGYLLYKYFLSDVLSPKPVVTKTASGYDVTQGGTTSSIKELNNASSFNFGVTIYPGAQEQTGQASGAQVSLGNKTMTTGVFTTRSSVADVVSYYTKEFGANAALGEQTIGSTVQKTITLKDSADAPVVAVSSDGKLTTIQIVSVK